MLFERVYDADLAQASYVIGCQETGEAIVFDARRDTDVYHDIAERNGMSIVAVAETHVHADYLSGTRELAADSGALMYVSAEGGPDWLYQFDARSLHHKDRISIGNVTVEALHTPGHTPEHLSFLITDGARTDDDPGFMLTGDFVFVGDLGRPDLLDEAAGGEDTRFESAKQMYASLRDQFLTLPDYIQVLPAHGAGSACGKALGAVPTTTVGYERNFSWWAKYLENEDEQGFINNLLEDQPDVPAYFARMKRQNVQGPPILGRRSPLPKLEVTRVTHELAEDRIIFVDPRSADAVHELTVKAAINIPAENMATYGAWAIDPETDTRALVLLADNEQEAHNMWDHLIRVGIDDVKGYVTSFESLPATRPEIIQPTNLEMTDKSLLLDVRSKDEYAEGAIPGAKLLHGSRVAWNLDEMPKDGKIVPYCRSGKRSSVVASTLRNAGYDVAEIEGSYQAWSAAKKTA